MRTQQLGHFFTFKSTLLLILISLGAIPSWAQRYNFQQYLLKDGLPQSQVGALATDPRGYLWIGQLAGGLTRFDGQEFRSYTFEEDNTGLGAIIGLAFSSQQQLWAFTSTGLFRYDGQSFSRYGTEKGFGPNQSVRGISKISSDTLFLQTTNPGTLLYVDAERDTVVCDSLPEPYTSSVVGDAIAMPDGRILLGTLNGEWLWWDQSGFHAADLGAPATTTISDLSRDQEGNLWALGAHGAWMYNGTSWTDPFEDFWQGNPIALFIMDQQPNGAYWFCGFQGVYRYWEGKITHFGEYEGLTDNQIFSLETDRQGNLWLGTYGEGLFRFAGDRFQYLTEQEGLPAQLIMGVESYQGKYYFSDFGRGIASFDPKNHTFESFTVASGDLPSDLLLQSYRKQDGTLLFGYRVGGWSHFNDGNFTHRDYPPASATSLAAAFTEDSLGGTWIGDLGKGLYRWDGEDYTRFTVQDGLPSNVIRGLYYHAPDSAIWVGTSQGMVQYRDGTFAPLPFSDSLRNYVTYSMISGPMGKTWMGLLGGGVASWDGTTLRHYTTADGLTSKNTYQISFDESGNLYQGTERGLDRITFMPDGRIERVDHFGYEEGFLGIESNGNAVLLDEEGRLWVGTVEGVMIYDPKHDKGNLVPPQTELLDVQLDYRPIDWQAKGHSIDLWRSLPLESPTFNHRENTLTFRYSGISLGNPSQVAYRYRLVGQADVWSPEVKNRQVTYTQLPPGNYTFEVVSGNSKDVWNKLPTQFSFTIKPPFWQTPWFIILAGLASIGLLIGFVRGRTRHLRLAKEILEKKVRERTEEIVAQKEEIEAQRDMIEQKNRDITDSIRYAQRIQRAILPPQHKITEAFPNHFILYRPRDIVSGDFYWFAEQKDTVFLAAVDCTGHGVPGAFMSLIASQHLNQLVMEDGLSDPAEILNQLNERVQDSLHQKGEGSRTRDGLDIALIAHTKGSSAVAFAGAKRSLYWVVNGKLQEIKGDRLFIGGGHVKLKDSKFSTHQLTLDSPTTLYLTSDGYADQFGGPEGRKFMVKRMKKLISNIAEKPMPEQQERLDRELDDWMKGYSQTDDILVIGLRLS